MVEYICDRCKKTFTKKSNYLSHLNRKNPCQKKIVVPQDNKAGELDELKETVNEMRTLIRIGSLASPRSAARNNREI